MANSVRKGWFGRKFLLATAACAAVLGADAAELPLDENGKWKDDVLYVETDGSSCYFDTGVTIGPNTRVVTCVAIQSFPHYGTSIGGGGNATVPAASIFFGTSGTTSGPDGKDVFHTAVAGMQTWVNSDIPADSEFHVWDLRSGSQRLDGLFCGDTEIPSTAESKSHFFLGARDRAWGATDSFIKMRIRSCKIYDGNSLVKDYIAAFQNGKYGLRDQKDGSFHVATKGSFKGKSVKAAIPVAYVESTSAQLHVDTEIRPTETTRVVADIAFRQTAQTLMGSGGGTAAPDVAAIYLGVTSEKDMKFQWYVGDNYAGSAVKGGKRDQNRHTWDLSSGSQKIDDTEYGTATISAGKTPGPGFVLFARRLASKDAADSWHIARLWGCKIYSGDALLRDLQPCYWNDRYCLKDHVTGRFFQAIGTAGEDGYGVRDLAGEALDLTIKKRLCLKMTGTQYLDTRIKPTSNMHLWAKLAFGETDANNHCMGWAINNKVSVLLGPCAGGTFGGWFGANYSSPQSYAKSFDTGCHDWEIQSGSQTIDGVEMATQTATSSQNNTADNATFFIGARNGSSNPGNPDWFSKVDVYGFKIWRGTKLVRDYVAAEVGGRGCLYDRVNGLPLFSPVGDEMSVSCAGLIIVVQ